MYGELVKSLRTHGFLYDSKLAVSAADAIEALERREKFHAFIWNTFGHQQMRQLVELYREQEEEDDD